jgi:hypothetical protein
VKERPGGDERLIRYLLDDASDEERSAVEREFLADDQRYEELEALEDELRHDYLRGSLSEDQKARFERRFLASASDRARLEDARAILDALDRGVPAPVALPPASRPGWWLAAAAAVCLALAGWAFLEARRSRARVDEMASGRAAEQDAWARRLAEEKGRGDGLARDLDRERERRVTLEQELTRREQAAVPRASIVALLLPPGLVRGAAGQAATLGPAVEGVRLTLRLPAGEEAARFQAAVRTADGAERWFRGGLVRGTSPSGPVVVVTVPARVLAPGDYEVGLLAETAPGRAEEIADYHFAVIRP